MKPCRTPLPPPDRPKFRSLFHFPPPIAIFSLWGLLVECGPVPGRSAKQFPEPVSEVAVCKMLHSDVGRCVRGCYRGTTTGSDCLWPRPLVARCFCRFRPRTALVQEKQNKEKKTRSRKRHNRMRHRKTKGERKTGPPFAGRPLAGILSVGPPKISPFSGFCPNH